MSKKLTKHTGGIDKADKFKELTRLVEIAEKNVEEGLSKNTRRSYRVQWRDFEAWCASMELPSCPADEKTLLTYLTHRAEMGVSVSTLGQAYSAIREEHRMRNLSPPSLDGKLLRSWRGARRKAGKAKSIKKALALAPATLRSILPHCLGPLGSRDRALLLVGWCGALRRDEIVSLQLRDLLVEEEGLRVTIRHSKTDQEGVGYELGIARGEGGSPCPVQAWEEYFVERSAEPPDAPAFVSKNFQRLTGFDASRILWRRMRAAGIPTKGYSAHSLRAGCITAAAAAGYSLEEIQKQSRHKSMKELIGYIRTATLFEKNITKNLL